MERKISDWGGAIAAFILVILVNYLSNALPLNGMTQKDLSDKYTSLFTPASFTFSIWGVIYLALAAFVIYQALPAQRRNRLVSQVSQLFIISCFANIFWLFAWHYEFVTLSLIIMFFILFTLVTIYRVLGISYGEASWGQRLFLHLPFSLYTGWITVATMANISVLQNALGWDDLILSASDWTMLKLAVVGVICAIVVLRRGDSIYAGVVAWAAYGIMSKQTAVASVSDAALMLAAFAIILAAYEAIRRLLQNPEPIQE